MSNNKIRFIDFKTICRDKAKRDWCCFENTSKKQDWEYIVTKLHFRIGPMTMLVLYQGVPPPFYNKIAPMAAINLDAKKL